MKILFMCVTNSALSQLAEALAHDILSDRARVASAGSRPSQPDPCAVKALEELGMDGSRLQSKRVEDLSEEFLHDLDFVITLCDEDLQHPLTSQAKRLHWPMPTLVSPSDNQQEQIERCRKVLHHLRTQIEEFGREYEVLRARWIDAPQRGQHPIA